MELETLQDDSESPEVDLSDFEGREREREREDYDGSEHGSDVSKQSDSDDEGP